VPESVVGAENRSDRFITRTSRCLRRERGIQRQDYRCEPPGDRRQPRLNYPGRPACGRSAFVVAGRSQPLVSSALISRARFEGLGGRPNGGRHFASPAPLGDYRPRPCADTLGFLPERRQSEEFLPIRVAAVHEFQPEQISVANAASDFGVPTPRISLACSTDPAGDAVSQGSV
jgi:hypothetical protein